MDKAVLDDLRAIQSAIYINSKSVVERWSRAIGIDYQVPLVLLIGFMANAVQPICRVELRLRNLAEHDAAIEIIKNSSLCKLIAVDDLTRIIRYHDHVSKAVQEEIASEIAWHSSPLTN
jgi:hypothetical protein